MTMVYPHLKRSMVFKRAFSFLDYCYLNSTFVGNSATKTDLVKTRMWEQNHSDERVGFRFFVFFVESSLRCLASINSGFNRYQRIPLWCLILSLENTNTVLIANKLILPAKSEGPIILLLVQWLQKYCPSLIGFLTFLAQHNYVG